MNLVLNITLLLTSLICVGQSSLTLDSLRKAYNAEMKIAGNTFSEKYYPNIQTIYSLHEKQFLGKVDSLKQPFLEVSKKYEKRFNSIDKTFIANEERDISYFFDKTIVDYPYFHENYTGNKTKSSTRVQKKLNAHLKDFNDPGLLSNKDFLAYVNAVLRHRTTVELKKEKYKKSDNKRLCKLPLKPNCLLF